MLTSAPLASIPGSLGFEASAPPPQPPTSSSAYARIYREVFEGSNFAVFADNSLTAKLNHEMSMIWTPQKFPAISL
jgi:hypothetical protein